MRTDKPPRIRDDLVHRIELVSMDPFCEDVTLSLYRVGDGRAATVHSYSGRAAVPYRLSAVARAMSVLGGMRISADERTLSFACGSWHERAVRRVFLEACKSDSASVTRRRPLAVNDARTNQQITATPLGSGGYRIDAVAHESTLADRATSIAAGLAKLMDVEIEASDRSTLRFTCGASHDELVGVLLPRAINIRATLREQEQAATKGVLVAPSAQAAPGV